MNRVVQFVGPNGAVQLFGVKLVGVNGESGKKLLFTIAFLALVCFLAWGIGALAGVVLRQRSRRFAFWTKQGIHLFSVALLIIGFCSIWFDDPVRLATAFGLVTAGLAFALQRVITALAAYRLRIVMGGVRGDVIELGFIQTTIMEMGQPPPVQSDDPAMWVKARQYTGRIVTITNDKIFETPVFNYTRDIPFIWEEMQIPISYQADVRRAEEIIVAAARKFTAQFQEIGEQALAELERRYFVQRGEFEPKMFMRLTDSWIELTVRFITREYGVREVKNKMSREILAEFNKAGLGIASSTYDIVGMPPISVRLDRSMDSLQE